MVVCHRCGALMERGMPPFYVVRIEAWAYAVPPDWDVEEGADVGAEMAELIEAARKLSEQELMDEVFRRMTVHLCPRCYRQWIENPTGE